MNDSNPETTPTPESIPTPVRNKRRDRTPPALIPEPEPQSPPPLVSTAPEPPPIPEIPVVDEKVDAANDLHIMVTCTVASRHSVYYKKTFDEILTDGAHRDNLGWSYAKLAETFEAMKLDVSNKFHQVDRECGRDDRGRFRKPGIIKNITSPYLPPEDVGADIDISIHDEPSLPGKPDGEEKPEDN